MQPVQQWNVLEVAMTANDHYDNPFADVTVTVTLISPSGARHTTEAFWDGGRTWRFRFAPGEVGRWQWQTQSTAADDAGLHAQHGEFECVSYQGDNPIFAHGPLRLSADRRYLQHIDGTPFFWLADTAWNGVLRAKEDDWMAYLEKRRFQGFTVIQFVCTNWRGSTTDPYDERAYEEGDGPLRINPQFFQRMDAKVAAINEAGLLAAPVVLWAVGEGDPGYSLAEPDAILLARYIVARWGAHQVVWLLGGDGDYAGPRAERWKAIGRAVFGQERDRLVTMHPGGRKWPYRDLAEEPWLDIVGYQSSHGGTEETLLWIVHGPPATEWTKEPARPFINLEPSYEAHPASGRGTPFTDADVRRAVYWSLLNAPTAGATYGHNWVWPWREEPGPPEGHVHLGEVRPWREALDAPGAQCMGIMRRLLESLPWWELRPAPELLLVQPGEDDIGRFVTVSATQDRSAVVAYTPAGCELALDARQVPTGCAASWFNPRTGERIQLGRVDGEELRAETPDDQDWVLVVRRQ